MKARPYRVLAVSHEGGVALVTLTNPARKNAIGPRMMSELLSAFEDAHADESVRSIVITGAGDAFCAGGDFADITSGDADEELLRKGDFVDVLLAIVKSDKPVVAKVNGLAMGGGLGIVAACHFAIAADTVKLATPEINVGLFPMMIMAVLARVVPRRKLLEMMLLGEKMTAEEGRACGLVGSVVAAAELDAAVHALTTKIASKSPMTVKLGLDAYNTQADMSLEEALPMLRDRLGACLTTEDAREGLMAFMQKRPPVWKGR